MIFQPSDDGIVEALRARLDKIEKDALEAKKAPDRIDVSRLTTQQKSHIERWGPDGVMAEVAVQRAILDEYIKLKQVAERASSVRPEGAQLVDALAAGLEIAVRLHAADPNSQDL